MGGGRGSNWRLASSPSASVLLVRVRERGQEIRRNSLQEKKKKRLSGWLWKLDGLSGEARLVRMKETIPH